MSLRIFTTHPHAVGESYLQHLAFAMRFGGSMLIGGIACMVHGLLPFLCTTSGSRRVRSLHATLNRHPARRVEPEALYNWSI
jgi:hypothetical protein